MNQLLSKQPQALRCKSSIVSLAVISLVCTVVSCIAFFVIENLIYYSIDTGFLTLNTLIDNGFFVSYVLSIVAICLLIKYIFKHDRTDKSTFRIPVIFGLATLSAICDLIIITSFYPFRYIFCRFFPENIIVMYSSIIVAIAFAFATIGACNGFRNKLFLIIPIVTAIIATLFPTCVDMFNLYQYELSWSDFGLEGLTYLFATLILALGSIAFYVALLLLGLKNELPSALKGKDNPENELKLLNEKLKLGIITEEEYQAQRADIISRL